MPTYNPLDSRFLTTANAITRDGQKFVRIILDIQDNVFYTLDDDGNFNPIGSGGTSSSGVTSINVGTGLSANSTTGAVTITYTGGTGNTYTSTNGITQNPTNNFKLGGALSENTTITGSGYNFRLSGITALNFDPTTYNNTANNLTSQAQHIMTSGVHQLVQTNTAASVQSLLELYPGYANFVSVTPTMDVRIVTDAQNSRLIVQTPKVFSGTAAVGDILTYVAAGGTTEFVTPLKVFGSFNGDTYTDGGVQNDWYYWQGTYTEQTAGNVNMSSNGSKLQTDNFTDVVMLMFVVVGEIEDPTSETIEVAWGINDNQTPNITGSYQKVHTLNAGDPRALFTQTFFIKTSGLNDNFNFFFRNTTSAVNVTIRNINVTIHRVD